MGWDGNDCGDPERGGECGERGEENVGREGRRMWGERGGECVERGEDNVWREERIMCGERRG